jgi:hypothetical protein
MYLEVLQTASSNILKRYAIESHSEALEKAYWTVAKSKAVNR